MSCEDQWDHLGSVSKAISRRARSCHTVRLVLVEDAVDLSLDFLDHSRHDCGVVYAFYWRG